MKRSINDSCDGDCFSFSSAYSSSSSSSSSSICSIDDCNCIDDRPNSKPKTCNPNPEPNPNYNNTNSTNNTTTMNDRAARLEEEAPTFRSAPVVAVARPPSLARGMGLNPNGLDRVPGDYLQQKPQFEEPKDDIRKMMAAEERYGNSKPAPADGAAAAPGESNWTVRGGSASLRSVPTYYPLEKSTRYVAGRSLEDITAQISDCCRIMSVHAEYEGNDDVPVSSRNRGFWKWMEDG